MQVAVPERIFPLHQFLAQVAVAKRTAAELYEGCLDFSPSDEARADLHGLVTEERAQAAQIEATIAVSVGGTALDRAQRRASNRP